MEREKKKEKGVGVGGERRHKNKPPIHPQSHKNPKEIKFT